MTRARAALAAATALLVAYALLRGFGGADPVPYATLARPAVAPPPTSAAPVDVRVALARLDRARAAGYAAPATADPDHWAAPGCRCRAEDARRLRALAARGRALRGHRTRVAGIRVLRVTDGRVTAVVTDRISAYAAVDARGRTVARWPASGLRRWRITLVLVSGRWVLGAVVRAPPPRGVDREPSG